MQDAMTVTEHNALQQLVNVALTGTTQTQCKYTIFEGCYLVKLHMCD